MAGSTPIALGRIFISYRRQDTAYPAGWLYDRLANHFGREQVFKDVDSIDLGDDFVEVITTAVGLCDVLIALIGNHWLTISDENGRRRLDDSDDFVRLEIETALKRNIRVVPVLVEGARMPRADELPPSLAKLVRRQALELSPSRFDSDTNRLLKVLQRTLREDRALPEAEEQAKGKGDEQIVEATAITKDAPPAAVAENAPGATETPWPTSAEGSFRTDAPAATQSDRLEHSEGLEGGKAEGWTSDDDRTRASNVVTLLAERARENGMAVRKGETHETWSFPLVVVDERSLAPRGVLEVVASSAAKQSKIRLVYVVADLPASQDLLDRFVRAAWAYARRGRLFERQSVSMVCMPVAILPRDQIVLPKSSLHAVGATVPVLIDVKTRDVSFEMPRRFVYARQARELAGSFLVSA